VAPDHNNSKRPRTESSRIPEKLIRKTGYIEPDFNFSINSKSSDDLHHGAPPKKNDKTNLMEKQGFVDAYRILVGNPGPFTNSHPASIPPGKHSAGFNSTISKKGALSIPRTKPLNFDRPKGYTGKPRTQQSIIFDRPRNNDGDPGKLRSQPGFLNRTRTNEQPKKPDNKSKDYRDDLKLENKSVPKPGLSNNFKEKPIASNQNLTRSRQSAHPVPGTPASDMENSMLEHVADLVASTAQSGHGHIKYTPPQHDEYTARKHDDYTAPKHDHREEDLSQIQKQAFTQFGISSENIEEKLGFKLDLDLAMAPREISQEQRLMQEQRTKQEQKIVSDKRIMQERPKNSYKSRNSYTTQAPTYRPLKHKPTPSDYLDYYYYYDELIPVDRMGDYYLYYDDYQDYPQQRNFNVLPFNFNAGNCFFYSLFIIKNITSFTSHNKSFL
jgi:hypothetical protein